MSIQHIQQFTRSAALVAPQYVAEIGNLSTSPERNDDRSSAAGLQCAQSFYAGADKGKPFPFAGGVAVIPVWGALLHRDRWCDEWATGYSYIESRFAAAMGDDDVKGILFDVNSYGGHVAGNFELCEQIHSARGRKPMMALVDSRALSGGYSIASAVGRIIATPSADAGSVGVVMMHASMEKMVEQIGIKISFIYAGAHKVDGNPYENLPDDVRAALQASVEKSYEKFVSLVARNRGMEPEAVRDTEARVYDAEAAKDIGLIDDVMSPREAFAAFLSEVSTSTPTKEAKNMTTDNKDPKVEAPGGDTPDPTAIRTEAAASERQRAKGIMACEEAKERPKLAHHLAFETAMSVEEAQKTLAAAGVEKVEAPTPAQNALDRAMAATGDGAGVEAGGDGTEDNKPKVGALLRNAQELGYVAKTTH
jgi:signal peptide peptidase SppA